MSQVWSDMLIYYGIIVLIIILESNGQQPCLTTTGTQGTCIILTECSPLLNLLNQPGRLQPAEIETLKNSQCGIKRNTPKVCCPKNTQAVRSARGQESTVVPVPPDVTNHLNLGLINKDNCGSITETRIIPGNKVPIGQYPWMALIAYEYAEGNRTEFKCGGSLINERYILTAAHCVTGLDPGLKLSGVRLGKHDLSKEQDCEEETQDYIYCLDKYQDFSIESFHVHGGYQQKKYDNDIALIRMNKNAEFRVGVQPICLPIGNSEAGRNRKTAIVAGWGGIENGLIKSRQPILATLDILPNDRCTTTYNIEISPKQICAGVHNQFDKCAGDRGGSLHFQDFVNDQPKYVQYGVVNLSPETCDGVIRDPGLYTNVTYYMDWILDTIAIK